MCGKNKKLGKSCGKASHLMTLNVVFVYKQKRRKMGVLEKPLFP